MASDLAAEHTKPSLGVEPGHAADLDVEPHALVEPQNGDFDARGLHDGRWAPAPVCPTFKHQPI